MVICSMVGILFEAFELSNKCTLGKSVFVHLCSTRLMRIRAHIFVTQLCALESLRRQRRFLSILMHYPALLDTCLYIFQHLLVLICAHLLCIIILSLILSHILCVLRKLVKWWATVIGLSYYLFPFESGWQ